MILCLVLLPVDNVELASIFYVKIYPSLPEMKMGPTKTIAWLLVIYWTSVGIVNLAYVEGFSLKSVAELFGYIVLGWACYFLTTKIGSVFSSQSKTKKREEISRRRS